MMMCAVPGEAGSPRVRPRRGRGRAVVLLAAVWLALAAASGARAQTEVVSPNEERNGSFGCAVGGVPDVTGDGRGDAVIGTLEDGTVLAGRAYVVDGATGSVLQTLTSPYPGDSNIGFGRAVSGLPDATGDGRGDVIVGSAEEGDGRAYIYSGASGVLHKTLSAPASGTGFGLSVAGLRDTDGDGFGDVAVGAPTANRVYIYSGATGALLMTLPGAGTGKLSGSFGAALVGLDDVTRDGLGDLAVGAPDAGMVHVFDGHAGLLLYSLGPTAGRFGAALAAVSDVSGDDLTDLAVGCPDSQKVYLFNGHLGQPTPLLVLQSPNQEEGGRFGASLSGIGRWPGLIVGAPEEDPGSDLASVGRAYVFNALNGAMLNELVSGNPEQRFGRFGYAVAGIPSSDPGIVAGAAIVGAPMEQPGTSPVEAGRAYVFSTLAMPVRPVAGFVTDPPEEGVIPLVVEFDDKSVGAPVARLWDFDGDGKTDRANPDLPTTYTYGVRGTYQPSLTVTWPVGSHMARRSLRARAPDLRVESAWIAPTSPTLVDHLRLGINVRNSGDADSPPCSFLLRVDDQDYYSGSLPLVVSGEGLQTVQDIELGQFAFGVHDMTIIVDAANVVVESDETNNTLVRTVDVRGPDLVVDGFAASRQRPLMGEEVFASFTIRNNGNADAGASECLIRVDGAPVYEGYGAAIAGDGGSYTFEGISIGKPGHGPHVIHVMADADQEVMESSESNNDFATTITVIAPDLELIGPIFTPAEPLLGQRVNVSFTALNVGDAASSPTTWSLYKVGGIGLTTGTLRAVTSGTLRSLDAEFDPAPLGLGQHQLELALDSANLLVEPDETNNSGQASLTLRAPDLTVSDLELNPSGDILVDTTPLLSFRVRNMGNTMSQPSTYTIEVDGTAVVQNQLPAVAAGETLEELDIALGLLTPGRHLIRVLVDAADALTEWNEENNDASITIDVLAADLEVEWLWFDPSNPTTDDRVKLSFTARNVGTASAGECAFTVRHVDGPELFSGSLPELAANSSGPQHNILIGLLPFGNNAIRVDLDSENEIPESREGNNSKVGAIYVTVAEGPDLLVSEIEFEPASPAVGDEVRVSMEIDNVGSHDAGPSSYTIRLAGADAALTAGAIPPVAVGESVSIEDVSLGSFAEGAHELVFLCDATELLEEPNEANNRRRTVLEVAAIDGIDLAVYSMSFEPKEPTLATGVSVEFEVRNRGNTASTTATCTVSLVGAEPFASVTCLPLQPGESLRLGPVAAPETLPHGLVTVLVRVDTTGENDETNEENNAWTGIVQVRAPDLAVASLRWEPESPADAAATLDVFVEVANEGDAKAGESRCQIMVDGVVVRTLGVDEIGAGGMLTLEAEAIGPFAKGVHAIRARVDSDDDLVEIDESHNALPVLYFRVGPMPTAAEAWWRLFD